MKTGQTQNAFGQFISFPSVREKKFTDIIDIITLAEISLLAGIQWGILDRESSLNVYSMRGKINFGSGVYNTSPFL